MTAITPLTTRFHEITPLTTKSERCYNQPPLYIHVGPQNFLTVLNKNKLKIWNSLSQESTLSSIMNLIGEQPEAPFQLDEMNFDEFTSAWTVQNYFT